MPAGGRGGVPEIRKQLHGRQTKPSAKALRMVHPLSNSKTASCSATSSVQNQSLPLILT